MSRFGTTRGWMMATAKLKAWEEKYDYPLYSDQQQKPIKLEFPTLEHLVTIHM